MLNNTGVGYSALNGGTIVYLLGDNYLNGYVSEHSYNGNMITSTVNMTYEFADDNLLIEQTETFFNGNDGVSYVTFTTYEYE